uniref:Omp-1-2 n=1 Tax=Ehrlichia ewingii TaxID=947 RepID=B1N6A4_9RICK|nr:Omp-1-2 [Ehrlichia ewingii]
MSYKKVIFWIILFLTPGASLSQGLNDNIFKNFYVGVQYKPAIHHLSHLIIKETSKDTIGIFALKKDASLPTDIKKNSNLNIRYNPHYENNNSGFSGLLGYHYNNNFRIESEISYEIFPLKNEGYKITGVEQHFALASELDTNGNQPKTDKYVTIINDGIRATSVLINACYDGIDIKKNNIVVYSCIGLGADIVDFLSKYNTKLSYQGKLGLSYPISLKIILFAEGYYHGLLGNVFNNVPVNYPTDNNTTKTTVSAILNIRYYGGSVGVRFIL